MKKKKLNQVELNRWFMQEHGKKKKKMGVSWSEYISRLREDEKEVEK
jgi:hypothetical protein